MKNLVKGILDEIGEDSDREGLLKTPERVDRSLRFLTSGYDVDVQKVINGAVFTEDFNEMVVVKDIELYSLCEHHMLPFFGNCHVGYIPGGKVLGLSKLPRIIEVFSRRLQVQERLTTQIANAIYESINPQGVAVIIEAQHLCMMMRGVQKQNSCTTTSCMLGVFQNDAKTRMEFLNLIKP